MNTPETTKKSAPSSEPRKRPATAPTTKTNEGRKQYNTTSGKFQVFFKISIFLFVVFFLFCWIVSTFHTFFGIFKGDEIPETQPEVIEEIQPESTAPAKQEEPQEAPIFRAADFTLINMQELTAAWAAEAGFEKRYDLTDAERLIVASVVTAEAQGEPLAGKMAVAQCILQGCEDEGIRPDELVVKYKYAKSRPEPSQEALEAVQAVFDLGQVVTKEPIKYFYAPARVYSSFHESQDFVITINNHRFFKEAKK